MQKLFAIWQAEGNVVKLDAVSFVPLCAYLLLGTSGCGTIMHGNQQTLHISSRPPGAAVLHDGVICGVTPCDVSVSRRPLKLDLVLWKAGYRARKLEIWNRVSLWALLGNVAVGGIPGWVVDAATGSFGAYYKDTYHVDFLGPEAAYEVTADSRSGNTDEVHQPQLDKRTASMEAWGRLRVGLSGAQARQILGEPQNTSRSLKSVIWFYAGNDGREGHVALLNGEVHSWREPGNIAREKGAGASSSMRFVACGSGRSRRCGSGRSGGRWQVRDLQECSCGLVRREVCSKAESGGEELYRWPVSPRNLVLTMVEKGASAVLRGRCQAAISSI